MVYDPAGLPIGVFDSGVGGLTVLAALRRQLPRESFIYLGDTARLPYGTKSPQTVARYALQAAQVLVDRGIKLLVIACNTASAVAVETLRTHFEPLPTLGVVEPGAQAACEASRSGRILVIGTEGTVRGGAYERAIKRRRPEAIAVGQPCSLFVALAEEGWFDGPIARAVAVEYLQSRIPQDQFDCLVLGCTHFPVFSGTIADVVGPQVTVVDSAETTALAARAALEAADLAAGPQGGDPTTVFLATDGPQRFATVGSRFLKEPLTSQEVELVDL